MGTAGIALASAVTGLIVSAVLAEWRDRTAFRRTLATRWDEPRLRAFGAYLGTANGAHRALLYAVLPGEGDHEVLRTDALSRFEQLHSDSEGVSLLTGVRTDLVRASARRVRQALEPLHLSVLQRVALDQEALDVVSNSFRAAREDFIAACQARLDVGD
jgi:hypothetical protein